MTTIFVFPGQGSQAVGMLADLAAHYPAVKDTFAEASAVLGYDLWQLVSVGPEAELNVTEKTQPAMLTAGVATFRVWRELGGPLPAFMAGHSLGEYSALVCSGALKFTDAVSLVAERGRFMQEAVPAGTGAMAAILGLDDDQVRAACAQAEQGEVVAAVNFNSPGQVVVAGNKAAVERAVEAAKALGAKRAVLLPVSVPSHCALMHPAAVRLKARLEQITFGQPLVPVLHNADVAAYTEGARMRDALVRQLHSPVRWVETIQAAAKHGVRRVVECGPGKVLAGLNKRIERDLETFPIYDTETVNGAINALKGE